MADRKSKSVFFLLGVQISGLNVPVDQDARLILWQCVSLCGAVMCLFKLCRWFSFVLTLLPQDSCLVTA